MPEKQNMILDLLDLDVCHFNNGENPKGKIIQEIK